MLGRAKGGVDALVPGGAQVGEQLLGAEQLRLLADRREQATALFGDKKNNTQNMKNSLANRIDRLKTTLKYVQRNPINI